MTSRGLDRCPGEPRLVLARAIASDQRWPVGVMWPDVPSAITPTADQIKEVTDLYEQAMVVPAVATEARIRAAWFDYRRPLRGGAAALPRAPIRRPIACSATCISCFAATSFAPLLA
jgi:hypothetical protein